MIKVQQTSAGSMAAQSALCHVGWIGIPIANVNAVVRVRRALLSPTGA